MPYTKWSEIKRLKGAVGPARRPVRDGQVEMWLLRLEELVAQGRSLPDGSIDLVDVTR